MRAKVPLRDWAAWEKFAPISGSSSSIKILFIYENKNLSRATWRHTLRWGFYSNGRIWRLNTNFLGRRFKIKQNKKLDFNNKGISIFPKERDPFWQYLINLLIVLVKRIGRDVPMTYFQFNSKIPWKIIFLLLTLGWTGSHGLIVHHVSSDHVLSKFWAQTALATRHCGFLVQLVSIKERKNNTYIGEIHRNIYETF